MLGNVKQRVGHAVGSLIYQGKSERSLVGLLEDNYGGRRDLKGMAEYVGLLSGKDHTGWVWRKALLLTARRHDTKVCREVLAEMRVRKVRMDVEKFGLVLAAFRGNWEAVCSIGDHMKSLGVDRTIGTDYHVLQAIRHRRDLTPSEIESHAISFSQTILSTYPEAHQQDVDRIRSAVLTSCATYTAAICHRAQLSHPDTLSTYQQLLSVCKRSKDGENAATTIEEMHVNGFNVEAKHWATLLACHSDVVSMNQAWKKMVKKIPEKHLGPQPYLAFIKGCGDVEEAEKKFAEAINKRGLGTEADLWHTLLRLYASLGEDTKFRNLYLRMLLFKITPRKDVVEHFAFLSATAAQRATRDPSQTTLTANVIESFVSEEFEDTYWKHGRSYVPTTPVVEVL